MGILGRLTTALAILFCLGAHSIASPYKDFETALRSAYADYRSALFLTNANKQSEAVVAIGAFQDKWSALARGTTDLPPQYADDVHYQETLAKVAEIAGAAKAEAAAGRLSEAHASLEAVREQIGKLHERNGLMGFSDRMNAYHAVMEHVLAGYQGELDAAMLGSLREDAAVLAFLAGDLAKHPPEDAASPEFKPLLDAVLASVAALQAAARSADAAAVHKAMGGLKVPYSKLFLKFG